MKPIAALIMALLIGMTAASTSTAESRDGKGHKGGFWAKLELTAEQQEQIKQLRERMRAHKEEFKERGERPSKEEMEALKLEYEQALADILTPEQQARLEEMKAPGKGRAPGGGKGRGHRRGHPIMHALKKLDLSDAQRESIKALFEGRKADMEQRKATGERPTREEMRAQREEMKAALADILTPEQQARLEEMKASGKGRGPGGKGRGHRRGPPIMHALKKLNLSDAQWASIKELFAARKADMEQRKAAGERPTREEMEAQGAQMKDAIAAILTPEQQQQLEDLRAARGEGGEVDAELRTIENALYFDAVPPTVTESKSWGQIKAESEQD